MNNAPNLEKAILLSEEISSVINEYSEFSFEDLSEHEKFSFALLQQTEDIEKGIILLLKNKNSGAAFVLARSLFETYIRATLLEDKRLTLDETIQLFNDGKYKIDKALNEICESGNIEYHWLKKFYKINRKIMNDYTHGGEIHYLNRCSSGVIESQYPEKDQISLIHLGIEIKIRAHAKLLARSSEAHTIELFAEKVLPIKEIFFNTFKSILEFRE